MTRKEYKEIASHFSRYQGREVEYRNYIPSANRYGKTRGYIHAIGRDVFVISERCRTHLAHYTDVTLI